MHHMQRYEIMGYEVMTYTPEESSGPPGLLGNRDMFLLLQYVNRDIVSLYAQFVSLNFLHVVQL